MTVLHDVTLRVWNPGMRQNRVETVQVDGATGDEAAVAALALAASRWPGGGFQVSGVVPAANPPPPAPAAEGDDAPDEAPPAPAAEGDDGGAADDGETPGKPRRGRAA